jgi:hypothetical protein
VERHCQIATDPNPDLERPFGLYGNLPVLEIGEIDDRGLEARDNFIGGNST